MGKESAPSRFPKKLARAMSTAATLAILASCSGGEKSDPIQKTNEKIPEPSGYSLPFPTGETWYLTNGPHADGYSNGIKYGIDIAPPELGRLNGSCPTDGSRLSIDNRVVTASASGEVIAKGDDANRNDPHHSEIRIKDKDGLTEVYVHLDNIKVKLGDKINQGATLGNPSCEFPPGGGNSGPHVHIGLMRDGIAIPIDGMGVGGWTIHENGTMTKPGEKTRTANTGRYGENSTGIRNDLPNNSNKTPVEKKISISKNPEELFKALLTTPFPNDSLPQGMISRGNTRNDEIDNEEARAFKMIYGVNIAIDDNVLKKPDGHISYIICSDATGAKAAYDTFLRLSNGRELKNYPHPTLIHTEDAEGAKKTFVMTLVGNVVVNAFLRGDDQAILESRTMGLSKAGLEYLGKVGR